jgi:hypothetical protein
MALASQLNKHVFNGITILQDKKTGYLDATSMCQATNKQLHKYTKQVGRQHSKISRNLAFLAEQLTSKHNRPYVLSDYDPTALIFTRRGRGNHTWVHPLVAIDLAMWCSKEFHYSVLLWTCRFLSGDPDAIRVAISNRDAVRGTTTLVTTTTVPPCTMSAADHANLHDRMTQQHTSTVRAQHAQRFGDSHQVDDTSSTYPPGEGWPVDLGDDVCMFTTTVQPTTDAVPIVQSQWRRLSTPTPSACPTTPSKEATPTQGVVYFIRAGDTDQVKVGYTEDLSTRLSTLQTANALFLVVECQFLTSEFVAMEKNTASLSQPGRPTHSR